MSALINPRLRSYAFQKAFPRSQICRSFARRGFASVATKTPKFAGDAVWAAGSIAITIPSCWYLLSNRADQKTQHAHHDDDHEKSEHETKESNTEELEASVDEVSQGDGVECGRDNNLEVAEQQNSGNEETSQNKTSEEISEENRMKDCKEIKGMGAASEQAEDLNIESDEHAVALNSNTSHPIDCSDSSGITKESQRNADTTQTEDADLKSS